MKDDKKIFEQIENIKKKCERYLHCVFLTIGLKEFVETKSDLNLRFISSEKNMKDTTNNVVGTPDIVLQYRNVSEGILIELKCSVPISKINFDYFLADALEQLQKYDKELIGWDTYSGMIDNHSIVLLIDYEDSRKTKTSILKAIDAENISFEHILTFWEWVLEPSVKFGKKEVITIRNIDEKSIGNKLGDYLENNDIYIEIEKINKTYDLKKYVFIRQRPEHIYYIINILTTIIFPAIGYDEKGHLKASVDEIMNLAEKYLPKWLPDSGIKSQLKRSWVNEALEVMESIEFGKKIGNTFEIQLPREKNIDNYVLEKLAEIDIKTHEYDKIKVEKNNTIKTIYDFENK